MRIRVHLFTALVVVLSMVAAAPAVGAPPLPDAGISLQSSTEATASATAIHYGDSVSFDHWIDGKTSKKYYLTIRVLCQQGEQTVYDWFGQPDFAFPLVDQLVNGTWWDGGDASCTAHLRYFANNKLSIIAETHFDVFAAA